MLDIIRKQLSSKPNKDAKVFKLREYLQVLALKILYDKGYFKNLAFLGGTALRLLYNMRRYSDDLDFSLVNNEYYDFDSLLSSLNREFELWNLPVSIKSSSEKAVRWMMLKFNGILFQLGLSPHRREILSIKLEIDQKPPKGWNTEISLINRDFIFSVTHFDLPSMFATKLHSCFYRKYVKGRDFYDLLWYLTRGTSPNYVLLNNAIIQTENENPKVNEKNFTGFMVDKLNNIDFTEVRKDIEPFIMDKNELNLLNREILIKLTEARRKNEN